MHLQVAIQLHKCTTLVKSLLLASLKCPRTYNIFSSSFYQKSATVNEIENAIIQFFELLYSTSPNLQQIRKQKYDTMVASDYWKIDPALLPPSQRAVFFHGSRVHRKIVVWKDLSDVIAMGMENWNLKLHSHNDRYIFFLSVFSFTNVHDSQDSRGRRRLFL